MPSSNLVKVSWPAGCLDKGAEEVAKLAYEKETLVEQLVEAQAQANRAEQAQAGLGEERNREEQLRRESENQTRVLNEEVQRLQAELARAKAQAGKMDYRSTRICFSF